MKTPITDYDIFFISYDEPNAESNWADLSNKAPWAKRVHGITGFDNAHRECAKLSETDRFITVDGDNTVDECFFDLKLELTEENKNYSFSWASKNMTNGLIYGNGGLKLWTKEFVLNMNSHENTSSKEHSVDFCWLPNYVQLNNTYSKTWISGSPFQSFRAGFREGVKMSLDRGKTVNPSEFNKLIHPINYKRLLIWLSIGADVENGLWSMYGARLGCFNTNFLKKWDFTVIRNYDWFLEYWNEEISKKFEGSSSKCINTKYEWDENKLLSEIENLGNKLNKECKMNLVEFNPKQSEFFKSVYINPPRVGAIVREDQVS